MNKKDEIALDQALMSLKEWHDNMSATSKKKTGVITIIGDMQGNNNHEIIVGSQKNIVMTLAQTMLGHKGFFSTVKDAINLVEEFIKRDEQEAKERKENKDKTKRILS